MKKNYTVALVAFSVLSLSAAGILPIRRAMAQPTENENGKVPESTEKQCCRLSNVNPQARVKLAPAETEGEFETLTFVDEDFSRMTAGSVEAHDELHLTERYMTDNDPTLSSEWTAIPGYSGVGLYQAGGALAIDYPDYGGFFNTPMMAMPGELTITFRCRSVKEKGKLAFFLNVVKGTVMNPEAVNEDASEVIRITPEDYNEDGWADVEFKLTNTYGGPDCFVQINTYSGLLIDDLKIVGLQSFICTPESLGMSDMKRDGFKLEWTPVLGATDYLLSVF